MKIIDHSSRPFPSSAVPFQRPQSISRKPGLHASPAWPTAIYSWKRIEMQEMFSSSASCACVRMARLSPASNKRQIPRYRAALWRSRTGASFPAEFFSGQMARWSVISHAQTHHWFHFANVRLACYFARGMRLQRDVLHSGRDMDLPADSAHPHWTGASRWRSRLANSGRSIWRPPCQTVHPPFTGCCPLARSTALSADPFLKIANVNSGKTGGKRRNPAKLHSLPRCSQTKSHGILSQSSGIPRQAICGQAATSTWSTASPATDSHKSPAGSHGPHGAEKFRRLVKPSLFTQRSL